MSEKSDHKKMHYELTNVGLRAQATAVGLIQLCRELRRAGVLDEGAIGRIKDVIADEIVVCAPRPVAGRDYRQEVRTRLNHLFAGDQKLGPVEEMPFALQQED